MTSTFHSIKAGISKWWNGSSRFFRTTVVFLVAVILLVSLFLFRQSDDVPATHNSFLVFLLIYLNVIFLCLLSFLIGRSVIKLIFDRRKGILGSRLQTRLVVAFAGIALVTNVILFIFAGGLVSTALESWFGEQVEEAETGAVSVAKLHYNFLKDHASRIGSRLVKKIERGESHGMAPSEIPMRLDALRKEEGLFGVVIIDQNLQIIAEAHNAASLVETFREPIFDRKAINKAIAGKLSVLFEESGSSQFIRGYAPITIRNQKMVLIDSIRIDADLTLALNTVNNSVKEYRQLQLYKHPLKVSYLLTLMLITVVILFSAIWFGLYISKQITTPLVELSAATRRVARGDYDTPIASIGDDEMGALAKSFNTMLSDLKHSRDDAEKRRLFIETILSRLAVGVIALNRAREVTSVNLSTVKILGLAQSQDILQRPLRSVVGEELFERIESLIASAESEEDQGVREANFSITVEGSERKIVCTAGRLTDIGGSWVGTMLLFDDVTELAKAQSMTVWREVARRIAHEIKNPLTPIQLSAQRLQKLVTDSAQTGPVLDCADTIVQNVDLIKRLANEFSNFARMPTTEFRPGKLNEILSEVIALYATTREDIIVQFIADKKIPDMPLDSEQIKRVMINLIDNALDAVQSSPPTAESSCIVVKTIFDQKTKSAVIEVEDNGPGIAAADKIRIFEPYFTTKKGGTGIGLAIVLSIISDHQGVIRVFDNNPRGTRFVITLPIDQKLSTQRRLAV